VGQEQTRQGEALNKAQEQRQAALDAPTQRHQQELQEQITKLGGEGHYVLMTMPTASLGPESAALDLWPTLPDSPG